MRLKRKVLIPVRLALVLLCVVGSFWTACSADGHEGHSQRYVAIRNLINENLHLSGHLIRAVDLRTVEAVRKEVSEADIPVLVDLLSDKENVVAIGAQHVLETFGKAALPALQKAASSSDYRVSMKASEAIAAIEHKESVTPQGGSR
jgi:HEAT repeat protein